jgi:iron complex outermembrane recepter protein
LGIPESAGNPFQIDVYYRGFTASPLLGTPEGLSVYVDSVRVNESFGDTVNWYLIPEHAINTGSLIQARGN